MLEKDFTLTEKQRRDLQEIPDRTGKSETDLIREAVDQFITRSQVSNRRDLLQKGRGIWKDRQDIPSLENLRREWDRR